MNRQIDRRQFVKGVLALLAGGTITFATALRLLGDEPVSAGGGATLLQELRNVRLSNPPVNGDIIAYDQNTKLWTEQAQSGGFSGKYTDLDFTLSNLTSILTRTHASLQSIGVDDHHAQLHEAAHKSGGGDAFASTDLLEAIVKRVQESGGPTTLTLGAVGDGQLVKRSASSLVGATPGSLPFSPTAGGDLIVADGTPVWGRLIVGSVNQKLIVRAGLPVWNSSVYGDIAAKTAAYTMTDDDFGISVNAGGGAVTITLPSAATKGHLVYVKKTDLSGNAVTVQAAGTDKIDTLYGSRTLVNFGQVVTLQADGGSNWWQVTPAPLSVIRLFADETDVSGTATNATAKTYSLPANNFTSIIMEAEFEVDGVANSAYDVKFQFTIGGAAAGPTDEPRVDSLGSGKIANSDGALKFSQQQQAAATIAVSVTVVTGTATWHVRSLRIYAVI